MDEIGAKSALQGSYMNAISSIMMGGSKVFGARAGVKKTTTEDALDTEDGSAMGAEGASIGGEEAAGVGGAGGAEAMAAFI
jgi:hypothetical protein